MPPTEMFGIQELATHIAYYGSGRKETYGVGHTVRSLLNGASRQQDIYPIPGLSEDDILDAYSTRFPRMFSKLYTTFSCWVKTGLDNLLDEGQLLYRATADQLEGYCEGKIKKLLLNLNEDR